VLAVLAGRPSQLHRRYPRTALIVTTAAPLILVSGAAVGMYSVVRYDIRIVGCYVGLLAVLAVGLWRNRSTALAPGAVTRASGALALTLTGLLIVAVPGFSYLPGPAAATLRLACGAAALLGGLAVALPWALGPDVAVSLAAVAYTGTAAACIRLDPVPRIDVWYTLQGAADGLARGLDMYTQSWVGPPGPMATFTYLPWTGVLLAPGRWLAGDVRWTLVVVTLCTALAMIVNSDHDPKPTVTDASIDTVRNRTVDVAGRVNGRVDGRVASRISAALLLLLPGTLTQVEQAWTEPLLLCCLAVAMLALTRGRGAVAVLFVALALASKQHIVLLLPVLAAWPRFGVRKAASAAGLAALLVLPWVVANPAAIWHDTVQYLVTFPPLKFADTVYIAVLNETGLRLPFWLTGAVVLATVTGVAATVHRRDPEPGPLLRWCALVLLAANLVNKQAFYNQYWLVAGLVLLSWAVPPAARASDSPSVPSTSRRPSSPA
jgi:hypothetical protein